MSEDKTWWKIYTYDAPCALNTELDTKCASRKPAERVGKNPERDEDCDEEDKNTDRNGKD